MTIFVLGNPDLNFDSAPFRVLPQLKKKFPKIRFEKKDPNEEWDVPEELVLIDTIQGIEKITVFRDLKSFISSPRITLHDFDALSNLRLLEKVGKLKKIKIIGLPPNIPEKEALEEVSAILGGHRI